MFRVIRDGFCSALGCCCEGYLVEGEHAEGRREDGDHPYEIMDHSDDDVGCFDLKVEGVAAPW
jgi:hypothetical protein